MGNWNINIQGTGCHHNKNLPEDADLMAADFVQKLKDAGHTVESATFTSGSKEDITDGRNAGQLNRIAGIILGALALLWATCATAATNDWRQFPNYPTAAELAAKAEARLFRPGEFQFDLSYYGRTRDVRQLDHGGGFGLNWLPWRAAGFGFEAYTRDTENAFFDRFALSLIGRMPIEAVRLAPEFRVGFDYDAEKFAEDSGQPHRSADNRGFDVFASVGAELRIARHAGIAAEARGVKPLDRNEPEHVLAILRLRLNF